MFRSIRRRLVLSYVFLVVLTLGVVGAVALRLVQQSVERQQREYLITNAEAVAQQAASLLWPLASYSELQELVETSAFLSGARVRILDASRRVVADSGVATGGVRTGWLLSPHWQREQVALDSNTTLFFQLAPGKQLEIPFSLEEQAHLFEKLAHETGLPLTVWQVGTWPGGYSLQVIQNPEDLQELGVAAATAPRSDLVVSVPISRNGTNLGLVEISHGPDVAGEAVKTTRRAFLLAAAGALLLAVIVGLLVSRRLAAPLRELATVAGRMSQGALATRAPVRGADEIGQLAGQFNLMAGRLQASFSELEAERDALRRFIADASHQLRTPITALRSFNDLLQGAAANDPSARVEFLAESRTQIDRLEWITQNLLDLSRLDGNLVALELDTHNVTEMLEAALSPFQAIAADKAITIDLEVPPAPLFLTCDRLRIELALSNLLDNALKFTPAGGEVALGAGARDQAVCLWVRDTGPGIDPDDLPHIFERFYRGATTHHDGAGLGLAIVQSITQAHGGLVHVNTSLGAGTTFSLEFPADR